MVLLFGTIIYCWWMTSFTVRNLKVLFVLHVLYTQPYIMPWPKYLPGLYVNQKATIVCLIVFLNILSIYIYYS